MAIRFPLLSGQDTPVLPCRGGGCVVCDKSIEGGFAYISAGASYDGLNYPGVESPMEAFFYVGYHGNKSDMSDSGGIEIVKDLNGGQFDLQLCSISCLRVFFALIIDAVEKSIGHAERVS